MEAEAFGLDGLFVFTPRVFADTRGHFFESFNAPAFQAATGRTQQFVQDNQSLSQKGVVRGLHYQLAPYAQGKLVRVLAGAIWDVAVDIRAGSPTYGQWAGLELSADNRRQFWIPEGFAHGFVALSDETVVLYKTTALWSAASERAIRWNDPTLALPWPISGRALVSDKDQVAPLFTDAEPMR
jgi:dTDP-4-dehydrorhamnose 3,5-epimerase